MAQYNPQTGMPMRGGRRRLSQLGMVPDQGGIPDFTPPSAPQPPAPGVSPAGGGPPSQSFIASLGIPAVQPDYQGILNAALNANPAYTGLLAEGVADQAQLGSAVGQAIAGFGAVPGNLPGPFGGYVTPEVAALAQQNTAAGLSTTARLQREHDRVVQNLMDALAARGMLRSSATGVGLNELQQGYTQATYDATQQLLDDLAGVNRAYTDAQRGRARELTDVQAQTAAGIPADRLASTPAAEATLADYDAAGVPVYTTPDGRTWTVGPDGNAVAYTPVLAPAATAQPLYPGAAGPGSLTTRPM